jgi:Tfp pilus assembly protein PilO
MADHDNVFLILSILSIIGVVVVVGMRSLSTVLQSRGTLATEEAHRELADKCAAAQTACAASLAAMQTDFAEMKSKLASIEKVLREVG